MGRDLARLEIDLDDSAIFDRVIGHERLAFFVGIGHGDGVVQDSVGAEIDVLAAQFSDLRVDGFAGQASELRHDFSALGVRQIFRERGITEPVEQDIDLVFDFGVNREQRGDFDKRRAFAHVSHADEFGRFAGAVLRAVADPIELDIAQGLGAHSAQNLTVFRQAALVVVASNVCLASGLRVPSEVRFRHTTNPPFEVLPYFILNHTRTVLDSLKSAFLRNYVFSIIVAYLYTKVKQFKIVKSLAK